MKREQIGSNTVKTVHRSAVATLRPLRRRLLLEVKSQVIDKNLSNMENLSNYIFEFNEFLICSNTLSIIFPPSINLDSKMTNFFSEEDRVSILGLGYHLLRHIKDLDYFHGNGIFY
jgi:hypothetical protein